MPDDEKRYPCKRDGCNGKMVLEADRLTHNQYHDAIELGLPSPFLDDEPSLSMTMVWVTSGRRND